MRDPRLQTLLDTPGRQWETHLLVWCVLSMGVAGTMIRFLELERPLRIPLLVTQPRHHHNALLLQTVYPPDFEEVIYILSKFEPPRYPVWAVDFHHYQPEQGCADDVRQELLSFRRELMARVGEEQILVDVGRNLRTFHNPRLP